MSNADFHKARFVAHYGSPARIDKLVQHGDQFARAAVAKYRPEHHDKLSNDEHYHVREQVAYHTKDKRILNKLSHDHDHDVAIAVASHGHKEHLDRFVNHPNWRLRQMVALHGHKEHLDKLLHDENEDVREAVAEKGTDEHRNHLMHDKERIVKTMVVRYGNADHHRHLMNDPSWQIRRNVAVSSKDHGVLNHLSREGEDEAVRRQAQQSLHQLSMQK